MLPGSGWDVLTERWCAIGRVVLGVVEIEGAKEVDRGVEQGDDIGPGDVFASVGNLVGKEEDAIAVVKSIVGVDGVTMPLGPPAGGWVGFITVVFVASEEVNVVQTSGSGVAASGVGVVSLSEIDLDEVPMGTDGAVGCVGDEKEAVARRSNGIVERVEIVKGQVRE